MVKCKECCYWKPIDKDKKIGHCKRNAPNPTIVDSEPTNIIGGKRYIIIMPSTTAEDECGEGKLNEAA